ncbi:MAG: amylo-alpha-1,6-glucosidase [Myxococcota bacterium]
MDDVIRLEDQFYILATSPRVDVRTRVLKEGDTFAVFDRYGDIQPVGTGEQGIFHQGTRFLSRLELRLGKERPLLLSSSVKQDNTLFMVDLANPDFSREGVVEVPRNTFHVFRSTLLWKGCCFEHLRIRNYALQRETISVRLQFSADYKDIFEVRGTVRSRRGELLPPQVHPHGVLLGYRGLDGVERRTSVECHPAPTAVGPDEMTLEVTLDAKAEASFNLTIRCITGTERVQEVRFEDATAAATDEYRVRLQRFRRMSTSNERFNDWLARSSADLEMMVTPVNGQLYPYAGVPWFSTVFGRDGILTALQTLWLEPDMARGVLAHLAATQAKEPDPERDAEPGKIVHETRGGEMAALREIPFGLYYGTVDATPLFVVLAGAYHDRTHDDAFLRALWPNILAALHWVDTYGDRDGDGFVEYARRSATGLVQQGWKDSNDSVFHLDGALADAPIALCEVQGYVYQARVAAARLAAALGEHERATQLARQAEELRRRFEEVFWCEELDTYALALDGNKRPCRVRTSNAGHCLWSGIASAERAARVGATLLSDHSFSGWGVRTVSSKESRYNPMSYHNGSIWPHDNAIIAAGLARYGMSGHVLRILEALFEASQTVEQHRLPELFCGFRRRPGEGPTLYPVACAPQAWASAAVYSLLQSALGLTVETAARRVQLRHPRLPIFLSRVTISGLSVGDAEVDLLLQRNNDDVSATVLQRRGQVEVAVLK